MRITEYDYKAIMLTQEERNAFDKVNEVLSKVQKIYDKSDVKHLESAITGECVDPAELARVKGILGFFNSEYFAYQIYKVVDKR